MKLASIDRIDPMPSFDGLPIHFTQTGSSLTAIGLLALALPGAALTLLPFGMVAAAAAEQPAALAILTGNPAAMVQLGLGLIISLALLAVPFHAGLARLYKRRQISISPNGVTVSERGLLGTRHWACPLDAFRGVTYHIRASLSGARHELILLHQDPSRHLLLHIAEPPAGMSADQVASLLGLPVLPARDLYRPARAEA